MIYASIRGTQQWFGFCLLLQHQVKNRGDSRSPPHAQAAIPDHGLCLCVTLQGGRNFLKSLSFWQSSTKAWWLKSDELRTEPCGEPGVQPWHGEPRHRDRCSPASTTIQFLGPSHKVRAWSHIMDHFCPPFKQLPCCDLLWSGPDPDLRGVKGEVSTDSAQLCHRPSSLGLSAEPLQGAAVLTALLMAAKYTIFHPSLTPSSSLLSSPVSLVT